MPRVLLIAYYFPPSGGAGVQRPLKFVKYLPQFGWSCHVLTVHDGSFFAEDTSLTPEIPAATGITRAFSIEPERLPWLRQRRRTVAQAATATGSPGIGVRLLRRGRRLLVPDAQVGWLPFAIQAGVQLHQRQPFDVIYSTSSPMTSHLVARGLKQILGVPWVADFRDPWADDPMGLLGFPRLQRQIERHVVRAADHVTTVTPPLTAALRRYAPHADKFTTVTNGFDPADLPEAVPPPPPSPWQITFVGTLYGPAVVRPFLEALARYRSQRPNDPVRCTFVGQMDMEGAARFAQDVATLQLTDVCERVPYVQHHEAVRRMQQAHVLLLPLYEGSGLQMALPGKLFEYLAVGRPVLAMSAGGAAADLIRECNGGVVTPLHDASAVFNALLQLRSHDGARPDPTVLARYSRVTLSGQLADILQRVCAHRTASPTQQSA